MLTVLSVSPRLCTYVVHQTVHYTFRTRNRMSHQDVIAADGYLVTYSYDKYHFFIQT